jgi:hypothetical protein
LTLLLAAVVVVAVVVTAGSRLNQSRLGGRNVRTHRRALGRLATITSEQPDRVPADVSQAHLHVRLVDEEARSDGRTDEADGTVGADLVDEADGTVEADVVDLRDPPEPLPPVDPTSSDAGSGSTPERRSTPEPDVEPVPTPVAVARRIPPPPHDGTALRGLEDRMAALRETEIEVSALPTGAVAALTRLGPAEIRSRRQRRLAGKATRRR